MNYGQYKNARNASWQCLIDYRISNLPVKVSQIAKQADIVLLKNSAINLLSDNESGITLMQDDKLYIVYADEQSPQRCRFTIAHELGHIFLGHLFKADGNGFLITDDAEHSANVFARDLLAPAFVLHELHATNAAAIANLCDISLEAASKGAICRIYKQKEKPTIAATMVGKIGIVRSLNLSNIILVYDIYFVNIYIKKRRV